MNSISISDSIIVTSLERTDMQKNIQFKLNCHIVVCDMPEELEWKKTLEVMVFLICSTSID